MSNSEPPTRPPSAPLSSCSAHQPARSDWGAGCSLDSSTRFERSLTWGSLTATFQGATTAAATFASWDFSGEGGVKAGGPKSVQLPGGHTTGDLLSAIAASNAGTVVAHDVFDFYDVDATDFPLVYDSVASAAAAVAVNVIVGGGKFCD